MDKEDEEKEKWKRPPSSYGSMKSESDDMEDNVEEKQEAADVVAKLPEPRAPTGTGYLVLSVLSDLKFQSVDFCSLLCVFGTVSLPPLVPVNCPY